MNLVRDLRALGHTHATLWQAAEDSKELPDRTATAIRVHFLRVRKFVLNDVPEGDEDLFAEALPWLYLPTTAGGQAMRR